MLENHVIGIGAAGGGPCMSFPPRAIRTNIEKFDVRMAVITFRQFGQQMVEFFQKNRIVEIWFPMSSVWLFAFARRVAVAFRSRFFDPFGRGVWKRCVGAGDTEGGLVAAFAIALHGRVQNGPFKMAFLRFDERPCETQIDLRDAFPVG